MFKFKNNKLHKVDFKPQYNGEKIPGQLQAWQVLDVEPNSFLTTTYDEISNMSSTLFHTHSPISAAITKRLDYTIGKGLKFRSHPDYDTLEITKETANEWAKKLQTIIDYAFEELKLYDLQQEIFQTADIAGDVVVSIIPDDDGIIPFAFKAFIGSQIIDHTKNDDNSVSLGVQYDKYKNPTGYWDKEGVLHNFYDKKDLCSILYFPKMLSTQMRGYPLAYKLLSLCKDNDRWWDATLQRAVLESLILGTETYQDNIADDVRNLADQQKQNNRKNGFFRNPFSKLSSAQDLSTGNILKVQSKGNLSFTDLKTPQNNFMEFQNAYLDLVGMATNVPSTILKSQYASFFAHKGAINDFFKTCQRLRQNFVNKVLEPIIHTVIKSLIYNEYITPIVPDMLTNPLKFRAALQGEWIGTSPGHINPLMEAQALILMKDNGLITPSYAAEQIHDVDYEYMAEQWNREIKLTESLEKEKSNNTFAASADPNPETSEYSSQRGNI